MKGMTVSIPFDNSYARLPGRMFTRQAPEPVSDPQLIIWNDDLARTMGIDTSGATDSELAQVFAGNTVPKGAEPLAQVYAGHQFGGFSPQLGDGRALLLGEVRNGSQRLDLQLKGSGPTPYSRRGDGRAWLGPVLREYLVSEAMAALGVPTTRALAAVTTGQPVFREDGAMPGAVLTRVASSHIRVGTFQFFAARGDRDALRQLFDHTVARHYPEVNTPAELIENVMQSQAELVARWMALGFIHGVMNTDNMAVSGETIDYGPCAFMDAYHPLTVFSFIDQHGRYAYANQPRMAHWNLAQFASALIPLMDDEDAAIEEFTALINTFPERYEAEWLSRFGAKFGLAAPTENDRQLITEFLKHLEDQGLDFTNSFAALIETVPTGLEDWAMRWQARAPDVELMTRTNPQVIPRTHKIEAVIAAGLRRDFKPFQAMLDVVTHPFEPAPDYREPPLEAERVHHTFCGT